VSRAAAALPLVAAVLLAAAAAGCRVVREEHGSNRFIGVNLDLEAGRTTTRDVAAAFGPPDDIVRLRNDQLRFVYRYRNNREKRFLIRFRLDLIQWSEENGFEKAVILDFDEHDRLLFSSKAGRRGALRRE
jgi:hypothetical protein